MLQDNMVLTISAKISCACDAYIMVELKKPKPTTTKNKPTSQKPTQPQTNQTKPMKSLL